LLDLKKNVITRLPGSDEMFASRVSHDGRYLIARRWEQNKLMLYDFQARRWSELAQGSFESVAWSHNSKSVYLVRTQGERPMELLHMSVPDGKVERVLDLKDVNLGGFWPGIISLLPDDSPLLTLDKGTQEIYRINLQFR
jgi:hypothetical protein